MTRIIGPPVTTWGPFFSGPMAHGAGAERAPVDPAELGGGGGAALGAAAEDVAPESTGMAGGGGDGIPGMGWGWTVVGLWFFPWFLGIDGFSHGLTMGGD